MLVFVRMVAMEVEWVSQMVVVVDLVLDVPINKTQTIQKTVVTVEYEHFKN